MRPLVRIFSTVATGLLCAIIASAPALAQIDYDTGADTVFAHSETLPWWLSAQGNYIFQWHPRFPAQYSGPHSFEHESIDLFEEGKTPTPEIDDHKMQTRMKYGFGINADQEFSEYLRGFVRAGWNEGEHESFNYTEVNETVAFGGDLRGSLWNRPEDKFGVAFVGNGLSQRHRQISPWADSASCWATADSAMVPS